MQSVRFLRKDVFRVLKPSWNYLQAFNFGKFHSVVPKKENEREEKEINDKDPYEGNFNFRDCDQHVKVTLIGAAGRVGRVLSLLLKTCPLVDHLCLFDTSKAVKGIGIDISHIDTKCCVSYVYGMRNIKKALDSPDIVVIAAGSPASPHLDGRQLFEKNAPIVAGLSEACARFCPKACVVLLTSPLNSLVPVMGEVYQIVTHNIPSRRLFGLTTLDVVRANTFVAEVVRKDPNSVIVPVIGGTSQETIVPVISQMKPCSKIKRNEIMALTECLKRAEGNLADCQNCGTRGASSLSTAYAAFRFTTSLVMALKGDENIVECAYVKSNIIPELEYLASPLKLGLCGVEHNFGYPPLSDYEVSLMEQAAPALIKDINLGKCFVSRHKGNKKTFFRRCTGSNAECFDSMNVNRNCYCGIRVDTKGPREETKRKKSSKRDKPSYSRRKRIAEELFRGASETRVIKYEYEPIRIRPRSTFLPALNTAKDKDLFLSNLCLAGGQSSVWNDEECDYKEESDTFENSRCKHLNYVYKPKALPRRITFFNTFPWK